MEFLSVLQTKTYFNQVFIILASFLDLRPTDYSTIRLLIGTEDEKDFLR